VARRAAGQALRQRTDQRLQTAATDLLAEVCLAASASRGLRGQQRHVHEARRQGRVPQQHVVEQGVAEVPAGVARDAHGQALPQQVALQRAQRQRGAQQLRRALGERFVLRGVPAVVALAAVVQPIARPGLEVHRRPAGGLAHGDQRVGAVSRHGPVKLCAEAGAVDGQDHDRQPHARIGCRPARERAHEPFGRVDRFSAERLEAGEQQAQRPDGPGAWGGVGHGAAQPSSSSTWYSPRCPAVSSTAHSSRRTRTSANRARSLRISSRPTQVARFSALMLFIGMTITSSSGAA
jgi:hypothetical protein